MAGSSRKSYDPTHYPGFALLSAICLGLLYIPLGVLVLFSFNERRSVSNWSDFSLDWYAKALANDAIRQAAINSLLVAVVATLAATVLATAAALATARGQRFRGLALCYAVINSPLMVPEIVTAVALLSFLSLIGLQLGVGNVMIAHAVFCIPFAYLPIRARLRSMDTTLEEAAADLHADPVRVFRYITLPLIMPGILAGAALAFVISLDDFIITQMVASAGATTLPVYIYGQVRMGVTPEVNAVSTMLLGVSAVFVSLMFLFRKREKS